MGEQTGGGNGARAAGSFSSWVRQLTSALAGEGDADVPCDGCTACCTSSQFVHIGPDEVDTLRHIPAALLFPAPRAAPGHVLLGYDENGHCPLLRENQCSIYEHRPRTCRTYDCRVFTASGIPLRDPDKAAIATRAAAWAFDFPTDQATSQFVAIRKAGRFLAEHPEVLPPPRHMSETQLAVLAVEVHTVFLGADPGPTAVRHHVRHALQGESVAPPD